MLLQSKQSIRPLGRELVLPHYDKNPQIIHPSALYTSDPRSVRRLRAAADPLLQSGGSGRPHGTPAPRPGTGTRPLRSNGAFLSSFSSSSSPPQAPQSRPLPPSGRRYLASSPRPSIIMAAAARREGGRAGGGRARRALGLLGHQPPPARAPPRRPWRGLEASRTSGVRSGALGYPRDRGTPRRNDPRRAPGVPRPEPAGPAGPQGGAGPGPCMGRAQRVGAVS